MIKRWSLIKAGEIAETITNGISGGKRNLVGGRGSANHTDEWLLGNGFLPHIDAAPKRFEQRGVVLILADCITSEILPKSREEILAQITSGVSENYDTRKKNIIVQRKVSRALARSLYLTYKEISYQFFGEGTTLTAEERQTMQYFKALGARTFNLESAETNIIIEAEGKTDEELQALPDDWESAHPDWTE